MALIRTPARVKHLATHQVYAETMQAKLAKRYISVECAVMIAQWWYAPGTELCSVAWGGYDVDSDKLFTEISALLTDQKLAKQDYDALVALREWVMHESVLASL